MLIILIILVQNNIIYILIIFNNPYQKYTFSNPTRTTQIETSTFLFQKPSLIEFLKAIGVQNQLLVSFGKALGCDKILNKNKRDTKYIF